MVDLGVDHTHFRSSILHHTWAYSHHDCLLPIFQSYVFNHILIGYTIINCQCGCWIIILSCLSPLQNAVFVSPNSMICQVFIFWKSLSVRQFCLHPSSLKWHSFLSCESITWHLLKDYLSSQTSFSPGSWLCSLGSHTSPRSWHHRALAIHQFSEFLFGFICHLGIACLQNCWFRILL